MALFKKKDITQTPEYKAQMEALKNSEAQTVNIGKLPPLEPPKETTLEEQIATTTEIEYRTAIYRLLAECHTILKKVEKEL